MNDYPQGYNKQEQTKKNCRLKEQAYKNPEYLEYLHDGSQHCYVCGSRAIEVHHLEAGAKGRRDDRVICLCSEHHRGRFSPHGADSDKFYQKYHRSDLEIVAEVMFEEYVS